MVYNLSKEKNKVIIGDYKSKQVFYFDSFDDAKELIRLAHIGNEKLSIKMVLVDTEEWIDFTGGER